jgi:transcriptional regulator GlxA family with amidase domain
MNRRQLITAAGAAAGVATVAKAAADTIARQTASVPVALLIDTPTNTIDLAGPWEVFQDVMSGPGFRPFTVAKEQKTYRTTGPGRDGGIAIAPHYTFANAPQPRVIVMGFQGGAKDPEKIAWIKAMAPTADVVMSVCTGAFLLANTGLLDGRQATTHHDFYDRFAREHPNVKLVQGRRWVADGKFVTAGGLTSGIDAALHVVTRFYGDDAAAATATYMEHDSQGWRTGVRA